MNASRSFFYGIQYQFEITSIPAKNKYKCSASIQAQRKLKHYWQKVVTSIDILIGNKGLGFVDVKVCT